jgi:hypothetical protein
LDRPGAICNIEQTSTQDGTFLALGADYKNTPSPLFASIAENFDWTLTVLNDGNTVVSNLVVQVVRKDPLSIFPPDSQTVNNLEVSQTKQFVFRFAVPHDAEEGNSTITVSFTTTYPDGSVEIFSEDFILTLQKSPIQVEAENLSHWIYVFGAIGIALAATFAIINQKRRRR